MEFNIPVGNKYKMEMTVERKDTAAHYGSGLVEVFATPAMIGLMEGTSQIGIQKFLPEGFITLGIEINVKHLKATTVGMKVFCESTVTNVDEKKIMFDIKAWDEKGEIGTATHIRYIVESKRFMERLTQQ
jgi:fluoroacetyl-CoA thioesterase